MENTEENKVPVEAEQADTTTAADNVDANTETLPEEGVQDAGQDTGAGEATT